MAAPSSGSSGSKMTPLSVVAEMKKSLTPEEYKQKLQEQLSLALDFEARAPAMSGFKMASSSNPRIDQQRALNIYTAKLKEEIHEDEVPHGEGLARPVDTLEDAGLEKEGGDEEEQQQTRTKKKRKKAEEREEKQDDLQDEEMEPQNEADEKKKKKRKKKRKKNRGGKTSEPQGGGEQQQGGEEEEPSPMEVARLSLIAPNTHTELLVVDESDDERKEDKPGQKG